MTLENTAFLLKRSIAVAMSLSLLITTSKFASAQAFSGINVHPIAYAESFQVQALASPTGTAHQAIAGRSVEHFDRAVNAERLTLSSNSQSEGHNVDGQAAAVCSGFQSSLQSAIKQYEMFIRTYQPRYREGFIREIENAVKYATQGRDLYRKYGAPAMKIELGWLAGMLHGVGGAFSAEDSAEFKDGRHSLLQIMHPDDDEETIQKREEALEKFTGPVRPLGWPESAAYLIRAVDLLWKDGRPAERDQQYVHSLFMQHLGMLTDMAGVIIGHRDPPSGQMQKMLMVDPNTTLANKAGLNVHENLHPILSQIHPEYFQSRGGYSAADDIITAGMQLLRYAYVSGADLDHPPRYEALPGLPDQFSHEIDGFHYGMQLARLPTVEQRAAAVSELGRRLAVQWTQAQQNPTQELFQARLPYMIGAVLSGLAFASAYGAATMRGATFSSRQIYFLAGEYMRQVALGGPRDSAFNGISRAEQSIFRDAKTWENISKRVSGNEHTFLAVLAPFVVSMLPAMVIFRAASMRFAWHSVEVAAVLAVIAFGYFAVVPARNALKAARRNFQNQFPALAKGKTLNKERAAAREESLAEISSRRWTFRLRLIVPIILLGLLGVSEATIPPLLDRQARMEMRVATGLDTPVAFLPTGHATAADFEALRGPLDTLALRAQDEGKHLTVIYDFEPLLPSEYTSPFADPNFNVSQLTPRQRQELKTHFDEQLEIFRRAGAQAAEGQVFRFSSDHMIAVINRWAAQHRATAIPEIVGFEDWLDDSRWVEAQQHNDDAITATGLATQEQRHRYVELHDALALQEAKLVARRNQKMVAQVQNAAAKGLVALVYGVRHSGVVQNLGQAGLRATVFNTGAKSTISDLGPRLLRAESIPFEERERIHMMEFVITTLAERIAEVHTGDSGVMIEAAQRLMAGWSLEDAYGLAAASVGNDGSRIMNFLQMQIAAHGTPEQKQIFRQLFSPQARNKSHQVLEAA